MDKKTRHTYMLSTRDPLQNKKFIKAESKRMEKIFHANGGKRKVGVAILLSDKIVFKMKTIIRDRKCHYIILKRSVQQEDISLVNIYAPNVGASKYIKKILEDFKKKINSNIVIIDFNTTLSIMDRSSKQKLNKNIEALNDTLDQRALIDI